MKCDSCRKDFSFFTELFWNGRYKHSDTMLRIRKRKMIVCEKCLDRQGKIGL